METENKSMRRVDQGRNVRNVRQILGVKQEDLAERLGCTQQNLSYMEQKKVIPEDALLQIANVLKVPSKLLKDMEENALSIVVENNTFENNTFESGSSSISSVGSVNDFGEINDNKIIHPVDKLLELCKENASLYERMLSLEKDKISLLEQLVKEK